MAFTTNESNAQVVEVRKLYTGIANLQIIAINPNNTELTAIYGRPNKEEPVYVGVSKANNPQVRIDIHAKILGLSKDTKVRFSFYVENFSTTSRQTSYVISINSVTLHGLKVKLPFLKSVITRMLIHVYASMAKKSLQRLSFALPAMWQLKVNAVLTTGRKSSQVTFLS